MKGYQPHRTVIRSNIMNKTKTTGKIGQGLRRGVGLGAAVAVAATLGSSVAVPTAQATTHSIEKQLMSAAVLHDAGTGLDHRVVDSHARGPLSACTGKATIRDFTHSHPAVSAKWTSSNHHKEIMSETIVETAGATQAAAVQKSLITAVSSCQHEPKSHRHYGKQRTMRTAGGQATFRYSYNAGDRIASGGVSVIKNGRLVGILAITTPPADIGPGLMYHLSYGALHQLGD